jgi:hypothetical protein
MLLRVFKSNSGLHFFLIPVTGILLLISSLKNSSLITFEKYSDIPFFNLLRSTETFTQLPIIFNFIIILLICFLLIHTNSLFSLIKERTFLPAYIFLFISLSIPSLHSIEPVMLAGLFILLAIRSIFVSYDKQLPYSNAFNAGFFTGLASLFYPALVFSYFTIPLSFSELKGKISWREYAASFIGLLLPLLYLFIFYFMFGKTENFLLHFTQLFIKTDISFLFQLPVIIYFSFTLLLVLIASIFIMRDFEFRKISTRRYYKILFYFFSSSALLIILPSVSFEIMILMCLPSTYLISNYFTSTRRKFWAEVFFSLLAISSFIIQYLVK